MERLFYHDPKLTVNFSFIAEPHIKLCLIKVAKSDACIRPLFANPVTFTSAIIHINDSDHVTSSYIVTTKHTIMTLQSTIYNRSVSRITLTFTYTRSIIIRLEIYTKSDNALC